MTKMNFSLSEYLTNYYTIVIIIVGLIYYLYRWFTKINRYVLYAPNEHRERDPLFSECPQFYPNGWLPVLESSELKVCGVKPVEALGKSLVVFRGHSGRVHVWDAHCPHLGAHLGYGGSVVGDSIRCPFHGWTFDSSGHCSEVPDLDTPPKAEIKTYQSLDINGFIMVWHHSEDKAPNWWPEKIEFLTREDLTVRTIIEFFTNVYIGDVAENGADCTHLKHVHGHTDLLANHKLPLQAVLQRLPLGVNMQWESDWKVEPDSPHIARTDARAAMLIFGLFTVQTTWVFRQHGPAQLQFKITSWLTKTLNLEVNILATIFTIGPLYQRMLFHIYTRNNLLTTIGYKLDLAEYLILSVINDDNQIWNHKRYLSKPLLTKNEDSIAGYRRYYKQFYR